VQWESDVKEGRNFWREGRGGPLYRFLRALISLAVKKRTRRIPKNLFSVMSHGIEGFRC
jgi:hypothetical protein